MKVLLDESDPKSEHEIIFELAPLKIMPHSIHLFLSQIAEGYWKRGTPSIALNAGHVLQACPHPCLDSTDMGGNIPGYPYEEMRKEGLDVVSFQEYSTSYPHAKYTIGFAGKPSGPEFFINMMDNTLDHGTIEERKYKMGKFLYLYCILALCSKISLIIHLPLRIIPLSLQVNGIWHGQRKWVLMK